MTHHLPSLDSAGLHIAGTALLLAGAEIHNSGASTPDAIRASFGAVADIGANTVLAPVAWEQFEPVEGAYDTRLIDIMVSTARTLEIRLVPLWFGSWKNGRSSYVPGWVKRDVVRFPRVQLRSGEYTETLTPFSAAGRDADAAAFRALMARIRALDPEGTVVPMVQVENEVGVLGDSRDRSELAESAFADQVPSGVVEAIRRHANLPAHHAWSAAGSPEAGSWGVVFGGSVEGDEAFMAHAYASYVEHVTRAGRDIHNLPCLVNAWLDNDPETPVDAALSVAGGREPGVYPSGGPVPRVAPIWTKHAPSIDLLAPDIYHGDFSRTCELYKALCGHLLVPETHVSSAAIANLVAAVGEHRAIGVAPFAVDRVRRDHPLWDELHEAYRLLAVLAESRAEHPDAPSRGVALTVDSPLATLELGDFDITVDAAMALARSDAPSYAVLVLEAPDRVLVVARGVTVKFALRGGGAVGMLQAIELEPGGGDPTRLLNGDETVQGTMGRFQSLSEEREGAPVLGVAGSHGIVRFEFYRP